MNLGNRSNNAGLIVPILVGGLIVIVGGLLISQLTPSVMPFQASAESEQVDTLFTVLLGIGGAIFLLVHVILLYSVIRFRTPADDTSDGPTVHGNTLLEIVWTAIPAVIVIFLVIYSYQVWIDIRQEQDDELVVQAIGARYAWRFEYDDPLDRVEQRATDRELHTYVGQRVKMELRTQDVIHSFWVPEMRIKQDLLPGRATEIRFTPTEPGRWRVVCAELCGAGHGLMYSWINVHATEEDYLAAVEQLFQVQIINPPPDPALRGPSVLANYACAGCHVLNDPEAGIEWAGQTGPALNNIGDTASRRRAGYTAQEYLVESLYDPHIFLVTGYGALMPVFQAGDADAPNYMPPENAEAIVAYLCTQTSEEESVCDLETLPAVIEAQIQLSSAP